MLVFYLTLISYPEHFRVSQKIASQKNAHVCCQIYRLRSDLGLVVILVIRMSYAKEHTFLASVFTFFFSLSRLIF